MNSENSKTYDPHRLLHNLSDKIDLQRSDTYVDYFLYQIFKIILIIPLHLIYTINPPIRIYVNQIENRITFRTKTGYYH